ncbi:hypothetical protein VDG1235_3738 [Verrucomicrobiia bacterium DG1235]|nr:hypothetical protein VDG1235_3738 [Verrucomicrobiae bacterium DG1235]
MSKRRKKTIRFAWKSACATCKALFQWCYSAIVLVLVTATIFAAYVATLDDIPVPSFIIRELRDQLKTKGLTLRMDGVRFQPNGRIIFEGPELFSPELGSTVVAAEKAVAKIKLSHLLFGSVALDEVRLSSGRFVIPAMLTPSGEPTTAISSINIEATHRAQRWNIHYATCAIDDLKLSLAGRLDDSLLSLPPPKPDAPKFSATRAILDLAPRISNLQKELKSLDSPFCSVELDIENKQQVARIHLGTSRIKVNPDLQIHEVVLHANCTADSQLSLTLDASRADLPQEATIESLRLAAHWNKLPTQKDFLPNRIQASATTVAYQGATLPSIVALAQPAPDAHRATIQIAFPERPLVAELYHDATSKETTLDLTAQLDSATLAGINPIAQNIAKQDLLSLASLSSAIDIHAIANFDSDFKPTNVEAFALAGATSILGANIDYASTRASINGPQIDVSEIHLRSGKQSGVIKIGYNLETLLRRVLVEGSFDPTMINAWFKPWWSAMWDGMVFPEEGMLTYLDSIATFKRPDTVRVTGTGYVQNLDLRGMPVEELRTRIFSLFHYVDLYDLELSSTDGQEAFGEVQFHMDRDIRDEKDKLTGIWIQALSTLDVKNAPNILWEIADSAAEILAPYCYDLPPFIEARSASVRHQDEYINDIDLQIETQSQFSYYGYPFESLETFVHIDDDIVDIPTAKGGLGGGTLHASAFIVGDAVEIDASLESASFGQTLKATNTYFANDGSETAQAMDVEKLLNFGGQINATFQGDGITGDSLSYLGDGAFEIAGADFGSFRMLGLLSMALEITPLRFTTLKFNKASSPFSVLREQVHFSDIKIEGPVATIQSEGDYNIETDALDFSAKLFPFRNSKVPLISPIINIPLNIFSNVLEVSVTGTFDEPQLRLFDPSTKEGIDVVSPRNPREHRPTR